MKSLKEEEEKAINGNDIDREDILTISREDASQVNNRSTKNRISGKLVKNTVSKEALTPKFNERRVTTRRSNDRDNNFETQKDNFVWTKSSTPVKKISRKSSCIKISTPENRDSNLEKISNKKRHSQPIQEQSSLPVRRSLRTPQKRTKNADFYTPSLINSSKTNDNENGGIVTPRTDIQNIRLRRASAIIAQQNMKIFTSGSEPNDYSSSINYVLNTRNAVSKSYSTRKHPER